MIKIEAFLVVLSFARTLYSFIDCAQKDETELRNLPKWGWLLIILFISTIGSIAYLIAGRPKGNKGPKGPRRRILPPDDDPDFLRKL
jgi:hypothetical protein